jgi:hypothetical protein
MKGVMFMFSAIAANFLYLMLPGFIGRIIIDHFSYSKKHDNFYFFMIESFIIGNFSYFFVYIFKKLSHQNFFLFNSISSNKFSPNFLEIIISVIISIIISSTYAYLKEHDIIYNWLYKFKFTNRSSNPSVLATIFGFKYGNEFTSKWINLRTLNDNTSYIGYILEWSIESKDHLEILMKNVVVYPDKTPEYSIYSLYLKIPYKDVVIEFHNPIEGGETSE